MFFKTLLILATITSVLFLIPLALVKFIADCFDTDTCGYCGGRLQYGNCTVCSRNS